MTGLCTTLDWTHLLSADSVCRTDSHFQMITCLVWAHWDCQYEGQEGGCCLTMLVFTLELVSWRDFSLHTLSLSLSLSLSHSRRINSPAWLEAASLTASWRWRCVRGRGTTGWEVWRHQVSMYWGETLEPALPVPRLVESGHTDIRSYTNIDTTTTTTTTPASQTPTTTTTTTTKSQDTTSKYRQLLVSLWTAQSHYQYKWP